MPALPVGPSAPFDVVVVGLIGVVSGAAAALALNLPAIPTAMITCGGALVGPAVAHLARHRPRNQAAPWLVALLGAALVVWPLTHATVGGGNKPQAGGPATEGAAGDQPDKAADGHLEPAVTDGTTPSPSAQEATTPGDTTSTPSRTPTAPALAPRTTKAPHPPTTTEARQAPNVDQSTSSARVADPEKVVAPAAAVAVARTVIDNYGDATQGLALCRGNPARPESMPGANVSQAFAVPGNTVTIDAIMFQIDADNRTTVHSQLLVNGALRASADTAVTTADLRLEWGRIAVAAGDHVEIRFWLDASYGKIATIYRAGDSVPSGFLSVDNSCSDGAPDASGGSLRMQVFGTGF